MEKLGTLLHHLEQREERLQAFRAEVGKLKLMERGQRGIEFSEARKPLGRDRSRHHAPVAAFTGAHNQRLPLHPVEQAGQVGRVSQEACTDLRCRQTPVRLFPCTTQDAQDVELRCTEPVRFKQFGSFVLKLERHALQGQIDLVLEAVERRSGFRANRYRNDSPPLIYLF